MSTDNKSPSDDRAAEQLITVHPTAVTNYPPVSEWAAATNVDPGNAADRGTSLFHALRRHWLLAVLMGSICSASVGVACWMFIKPQYTATAQLQVAQSSEKILHTDNADVGAPTSYDIFKDTQAKKVTSRFVIIAALRDLGPQMNMVPTPIPNLKREDQQHNGLNFLMDEVHVNNSKGNEILNVSMTSSDPKEGAAIVNAVVHAFFTEVVNGETLQKKARFNELQQVSVEKENELRAKRTELRSLADNLGTTDTQAMSIATGLDQQMCGEYQVELARMTFELKATSRRIEQLTALLGQLPQQEITESEVASYLQQNSTEYHDLLQKKAFLDQYTRQGIKNLTNPGKLPPAMARMAEEFANTTKRIEELRGDAQGRVRAERSIAINRDLKQLGIEKDVLANQIEVVTSDLSKLTKNALEKSRTSIDVQMKLAEISNLDHLLQTVNSEKDHLKVELNVLPRITVNGDPNNPAEPPEIEDSRLKRYLMSLAGMLFAFVLPAGALIAWDLRAGKINMVSDVQRKLGVTVLGSVPMIPARVIRRLGATSKRSQIWKLRLTESVDGVAARLLRKAENEQAKLILISSAMPGEGKTTLATQLAMSLARNMRRTVLVDFDLRRPALDGVFGVPQVPGICEALRGHGDVLGMVQTTDTENLSLVTAGRWDRQVLAALSNGAVGTILTQLRENFDFVIIDSSPILPIVDTRLVSQYVDSVVLSVFRDVSQGDKVLAAQEILEAFGVRSVEAVVTGGGLHGYGNGSNYESAALENDNDEFPAQTEPLAR